MLRIRDVFTTEPIFYSFAEISSQGHKPKGRKPAMRTLLFLIALAPNFAHADLKLLCMANADTLEYQELDIQFLPNNKGEYFATANVSFNILPQIQTKIEIRERISKGKVTWSSRIQSYRKHKRIATGSDRLHFGLKNGIDANIICDAFDKTANLNLQTPAKDHREYLRRLYLKGMASHREYVDPRNIDENGEPFATEVANVDGYDLFNYLLSEKSPQADQLSSVVSKLTDAGLQPEFLDYVGDPATMSLTGFPESKNNGFEYETLRLDLLFAKYPEPENWRQTNKILSLKITVKRHSATRQIISYQIDNMELNPFDEFGGGSSSSGGRITGGSQ